MKKLAFVAAAALLASSVLFAVDYEVKTVTGKVTFAESEKGKQKPVTSGMTLSDTAIVALGTNSKLVVTADGKDITLRTPKKASLGDLISTKNGISGSQAKKGKGTATAASRASDVMAEGELDD
ncbi:hypothetical protein [uncultured Treponema sp.]|uniref:hypothetical protein n=1 Tax=uncultured Treponema sp. TaxID=162155 RepID=UPI0025FA6513|nr:hypothetical protein [uncultured Treponema sp.]